MKTVCITTVKDMNTHYKVCVSKNIPDNYDESYDKIIQTRVETRKLNQRLNADEVKKLGSSLVRSRRTVFEYSVCNDWDFFVTLTFDASKIDRYDLGTIKDKLKIFFMNYKQNYKADKPKYMLVPEKHKDGAWHFHGLIKGISDKHLRLFDAVDCPKSIYNKLIKGEKVYNWLPYASKFGFCDLEPIKNHHAVSCYMTKYICKDLAKSVSGMDEQLYMCSRGLKKGKEVLRGSLKKPLMYDFTNDYCCIANLQKELYDLEYIKGLFEQDEYSDTEQDLGTTYTINSNHFTCPTIRKSGTFASCFSNKLQK